MQRRLLYLLIEESDRELKSRALIAAAAIERGFDVVLAPQWTVWQNWRDLPLGIVLFKGNNGAQASRMEEAKRHGHLVASIEEEALGICDPRQFARCFDRGVERVCDMFFANGGFQADELIRSLKVSRTRVHATGNPRIDLLTETFSNDIRAEAEALRAKMGDFVLINTNFSTINPRRNDALGCFDDCERVGLIDAGVPEDIADFFAWCAWERTNLQAVGAFVQEARTRSPWPVIVRPHPTEELAVWTAALSGMGDVRVIREGDHLVWTAAARALVHPGCTTGSEALMLGTPAVSLVVDDDPWHELYLSNLVNPRAGSADEAMEMIVDLAKGGNQLTGSRDACLREFRRHVSTGGDHLSCVAMVEVLDAMTSPKIIVESVDGLRGLRAVASTEGKIDADGFAPSAVAAMIGTYRRKLGYSEDFRVAEPVSGLLHVEPLGRREARHARA